MKLTSLAKMLGRSNESLSRSLWAKAPRAETIEALAEALGYSRITARALMKQLTDSDAWAIRRAIFEDLFVQRAALFSDPAKVADTTLRALDSLEPEPRLNALRAFELSRNGLGSESEYNPVLAPELDALASVLKVDLTAYISTEAEFRAKVFEAGAALEWLIDCGLFDEKDCRKIEAIASAYGLDRHKLIFRGALERARHEFRRTIPQAREMMTLWEHVNFGGKAK